MTQLATQPTPLNARNEHIALGPWSCCAQAPGAVSHPSQLRAGAPGWLPAVVPGTVAAALRANGQWRLGQPLDADGFDWWYRTSFDAPECPDQPYYLCCDGLATLAEVWLNGELVLTADNMFRPYRLDITRHVHAHNELTMVFRSLQADLARKRARPRWKTKLVNHQQLRWRRTSLLGRVPGWSPPVAPVGPWRGVRVETGAAVLSHCKLSASLERTTGVVSLQAIVNSASRIDQAKVRVGDSCADSSIALRDNRYHLSATVRVPNAPLWWPHTHGGQPRADVSLCVDADAHTRVFPCGKVGFRRLDANQENGMALTINDAPIYCRGACWTVADIVTLDADRATLAHDLRLARDAGVNMLRVGGTMIYESDAFYDLCDELGILVWQDFMFANMDYPVDDADFAASIEAEAGAQLDRLSRHPSIVVYCGNSEVEQQAAMLGVPRELWRNRFFAERLPALCADRHPGTAYVPSTPSGGVLPFHVGAGVAHFYGVGAYMRSPEEVRRADVKFAAECLGFANIPDEETINELGGIPPHHPLWKERVPRDSGAGWDFEDVRDHYLKQFFAVDPVALRSFNLPRYLQLSRVVTGEVMAQVFAEWRSNHSSNRGGLVWFFKDLWPGAGWGIVDSHGRPKAAYYYLRRAWANQQITLTDEGLDGLQVHVMNESADPFSGTIEVLLLKDQHIVVARQCTACAVEPRGRKVVSADAIFGAFYDVACAYRFGPPKHDMVIATLLDSAGAPCSEVVHFVQQREPALVNEVKLTIDVTSHGAGQRATLLSDRFLQSVRVSAEGFLPDDNFFHLAPARSKVVTFRPLRARRERFVGYLEALNMRDSIRFAAE